MTAPDVLSRPEAGTEHLQDDAIRLSNSECGTTVSAKIMYLSKCLTNWWLFNECVKLDGKRFALEELPELPNSACVDCGCLFLVSPIFNLIDE